MLEILFLLVAFGVLMFLAGMRLATVLHRDRRGDYDLAFNLDAPVAVSGSGTTVRNRSRVVL